MLSRLPILDNNSPHIDFAVNEVYATLSALIFAVVTDDDYPAVSPWLRNLFTNFPEERRKLSYMLFSLHFSMVWPIQHTWETFDDYIAWVAAFDADALFRQEVHGLFTAYEELRTEQPHLPALTEATLREDAQARAQVLSHISPMVNIPYKVDLFERKHYYFEHPDELREAAVEHLTWCWQEVFKAEWQHYQPAMQSLVAELDTLTVEALSATEASRLVTGRDIAKLAGDKNFNDFNRITFVPTLPIGPYLTFFEGPDEKHIIITFEVRDTSTLGQQAEAPRLSRAEILVRLNSLSDDTRLRILELFTQHDELSSQEVITALALSQSAASRHLRQLSMTGYLTERKRETAKVYSLNTERLRETLKALEAFLTL